MQVYKFGGASIKNAGAIRQLKNIVSKAEGSLVIVVSAMGKSTNKLEEILQRSHRNDPSYINLIKTLRNNHSAVMAELFDPGHPIFKQIDDYFSLLAKRCSMFQDKDYDFVYDQIISLGELISTQIISAWLNSVDIPNQWIDAREVFVTDANFRDAMILSAPSAAQCRKVFNFDTSRVYITQGFIAATESGETTTLGREGSDYSAALLGAYLDAKSVTLWKDVNGIYNIDPARSDSPIAIPEIGYAEMMELAYYGAKVIHPKAIKPLIDKKIPLSVKSFIEPEAPGTKVFASAKSIKKIPCIIYKEDQVLISMALPDMSFIAEKHISHLFALLNEFHLSVNLMQHAAIGFSVCVDRPRGLEVEGLIDGLSDAFKVRYNEGVQLITIRNYTQASVEEILKGKQILVEQRSRQTLQVVIKR